MTLLYVASLLVRGGDGFDNKSGKRSVQLGHYYMNRIYTMYCSRESSLTTPTISLWSTEHWGGGKKKRTHSHPRLGWIHFSYAYKR